ncbi:MAG: LysM domain-containing protein [Chloroflexi bacterium]|nr:LysM domain-containing protein [Chloroflexota bacterium]MQC48444.1 LysM domain-containing protein [Chloroflexota bacterium]
MRCFQCDDDATQECPRCGALYCDDHGDALCQRCTDPALALPSYRVYRGSLAALLVGSVVALWLLVLPPASADRDGPSQTIAGLVNTPTPTATPEVTPEVPDSTVTATPSATPTSTPEPTPEPTQEPQEQTYVVQGGDTLLGIAERFAPAGVAPGDFATRIQEVNGISDASSLQIGQELIIPGE